MTEEELRDKILLMLDDYSRSQPLQYLEDTKIGARIRQPVPEIQRQLDILESQGLVELQKSMGPIYDARITPKGMLATEKLKKKR